MIDAKRLRALLESATKRPWKQRYAYNNGGCPTADFYIPGHNGNATVEMLADDAVLIVEGIQALPELLAVFEAAVRFKDAHVNSVGLLSEVEQHMALGRLMDRRDDLLATLIEVLGEANAEEEDEDSVPGEGGQSGEI